MASFKKRLKHNDDQQKEEYSTLLNSLSMHVFSGLVEQHKNNFFCGKW